MWYLGGFILAVVFIPTAVWAMFRAPQGHWLEAVMIMLFFMSFGCAVVFGSWTF